MPRRPAKPPDLPEHLVADPAGFDACLEHLTAVKAVAFDTEFVGEDAYRPELCLVQVATAEHLYVIDPFAVGPLDRFWALLTDPARTTVVHAGREDIRLCYFAAGKPPANVVDVQIAAGLAGLTYPIGYAGLVQELLSQRMTKGETLTDWRRRPLSASQVRYAFDDVRYLLPAWKRLSDRLRRHGRLGWAEEEFGTFVGKAVGDEASAERWRRVKGLGGLDRRGLAVAREVFAWREAFAKRVNRPPRTVLRDDLLVEIARRSPKSAEDLQSLRGLPRGEPEAILEAVRRARALPPEELPELEPRENDPAHVVLLGNLLGVVLSDLCSRNKLAANLVASQSDLKAVVRAKAAGRELPDVPLTRGWRATAILPELLAVLDGRDALRVVKPASTAPLQYVPVSGSNAELGMRSAESEKPGGGSAETSSKPV
ncbi:MAG: HRDC domain-containing protein [Gemmataceae bacterium]|nr:HRDC domain-containing protein [Gemmataceae bacterium]